MRKQDASLVFFTTLTQWSVGITACLLALHFADAHAAASLPTGWHMLNPVLLALLLLMSATAVSFTHLGNPVNAPRALSNLATSWLSREILAIGLYKLGLTLLFLLRWLAPGDERATALLVFALAAGIFLLWTMTRVYTVITIPSWNSVHTPLAFAATALSLGLLTIIALDAFSAVKFARLALPLLLAVLLLEAVSGIVNQKRLVRLDAGTAGPVFGRGRFLRLFKMRLAMLLLACGLSLLLILQANHAISAAWIVVLFSLTLAQELAGRVLFYSSYFRLGL